MRDAVVSVAAGAGQLSLIETAQRLGLAVVAVDRDADAPGMRRADAQLACSTHDPEGILRELERLAGRFRLRAVATKSSGPPVATTARVADALGLPGLNPAHADELVDKPGMMRLAARAGLAVPRHHAAPDVAGIRAAGLPLPMVLKPGRTRVGKLGITRADTDAELPAAFDEALAASADGIVEAEEYVPGDDVVLAALFADSELWPVVLIDETNDFDRDRRARGAGFALPSRHRGGVLEARVVEAARRMVRELELGHGVGFFSFRLEPTGRPVLIEVHFDLAGDFVADRLFRAATGYDPIAETLRLLAGPGSPGGDGGAGVRGWSASVGEIDPAAIRFLFAGDLEERGSEKLAEIRALDGIVEVDGAISETGRGAAARVGYALLRSGGVARNDELARSVDLILGRPAPAEGGGPEGTGDSGPAGGAQDSGRKARMA